MAKKFAVYILASYKGGTLYIGMTSNLPQRLEQHQTESYKGFSKEHHVKRLIHFEYYETFEAAMRREFAPWIPACAGMTILFSFSFYSAFYFLLSIFWSWHH